jgi:hypothetical protein
MRTIGKMGLPVLAMIVGMGMVVSALVMSNTLTYTNQVAGVTLSSTWSDGTRVLGAENDFSVTYSSPAGTPSAVIIFEFNMTGIVPSAVSLAYWTGTAWVNTTFVQTSPNTIQGSTMTIPAGPSSGGFNYALWYNLPGTYTMKIWAG